MSRKLAPPAWWKNTYFWISAFLLIAFLIGTIKGGDAIRDPGQTDENYLALIYLAGAGVMLINGLISHRQYVQHYQEEREGNE